MTTDAISLAALCLSLATVIVGAWNAYQNKSIALIVTELRLNLQREFNGRYVHIDRFSDLKDRVEHLEEHQ
jgi:hypothetical protein